MTKLFYFFFAIFFCCVNLGCKDDSPMTCPNLDSIKSEIKINGNRRLLQSAKFYYDPIPGLDTYEFLIDAIGNDCNEILKFRFIASVPNDEILDGEFNIIQTPVYTLFHITSLTSTVKTIDPLDFYIIEGISGDATFTSHSDNEYTIELNAVLTDGDELDLNLRFQFE